MNKSYFIFLSHLLAGMKTQKQFFVSKKNRASSDLSSIFKELNIIKLITKPDSSMLRKMPRTYREGYLVF